MWFGKSLPAAVLFDLDGTLIDSEPYWMKSERALAESHGVTWSPEDGESLIGLSLTESSKIIKDRIGSELEPQQIIDHLTSEVNRHLSREIPWRPGAKEILQMLRRKGVKTALVTMSLRRTAEQVVDAIGFKAFDVIVAGDDVRHGKPHPEPYAKAAELLGVNPEDCVAFEDSITGMLSAEAAGTKAVAIENLMVIPKIEGRLFMPTLQGIKLKDLQALFKE
jgi:HAD superfamily hydrolase (TIGR01509 family)